MISTKTAFLIFISLLLSGCSFFSDNEGVSTQTSDNTSITKNDTAKIESLSNIEKCKISFNKGLERFKEYNKFARYNSKYGYDYAKKISLQKFSEMTRFSEVINDCLPAGLENNSEAQYALGYAYHQNYINTHLLQDYFNVNNEDECIDLFWNYFNWYQKAAEQGHAKAQGELAQLYWTGGHWDRINKKRLVKEDYSKAYTWAEKAAQQNDINGLTTLGYMYLYGYGVKQNKTKAYELYKKSSELGDSASSWWLATMLFKGNGVKRNYKAGIRMLDRAAKLNDEFSDVPTYTLWVAKAYNEGNKDWGLKPNKDKSLYYYKIACNNGYTEACKIR